MMILGCKFQNVLEEETPINANRNGIQEPLSAFTEIHGPKKKIKQLYKFRRNLAIEE
jgi:hypothetical protein